MRSGSYSITLLLLLFIPIQVYSRIEIGEPVTLTRCCPPGQILQVFKNTHPRYNLFPSHRRNVIYHESKCVQSTGNDTDPLFNGKQIEIIEGDSAKEVEVIPGDQALLHSCSLGQRVVRIPLNDFTQPTKEEASIERRVTLHKETDYDKNYDYDACGSEAECLSGNLYVDGKPVCDHNWNDWDAVVVCRELGFESGYATEGSRYGKVDLSTQSVWDEVDCVGDESSLTECLHNDHDDCKDSEGAGAFCYGPKNKNDDLKGNIREGGILTIEGSSDTKVVYQSEEFCVASHFVEDFIPQENEFEAVAVYCDPCSSKLLCANIKGLFDVITWKEEQFIVSEGHPMTPDFQFLCSAVVRIWDENGDSSVDFDEFYSGIISSLKNVFAILDTDKDGFLEDSLSLKKIKSKLLWKVFFAIFKFMDGDEDDTFSVEDLPEDAFKDQENIGGILIGLPAPIYQFYVSVDKNRDEKLSLDEASSFLRTTLLIFDQDKDCHIDIDDVTDTMNKLGLRAEFQLALKIIGDFYGSILDHIFRIILKTADTNGDELTDFSELEEINSVNWISNIFNVVANMGLREMTQPVRFLTGFAKEVREEKRGEEREKVAEMWMNVLDTFVSEGKLNSLEDETYCGL